jgi:rhodanese-related sulfurtransferase
MNVEEQLARARARMQRVSPTDAELERHRGSILLDIRSDEQRARDGVVPDAVHVPRNVLEWRCDPTSEWRDPLVSDPHGRLILMSNEGDQSSLAAAALIDLGLPLTTDLAGGFQAWRNAGLPLHRPSEPPPGPAARERR